MIKWGERVRVGSRQEPYYDVTVYRVPVTKPVTDAAGAERVRSALYDAWRTPLTGWSVGGYSTPTVRPTDDPMVVEVEQVYHIGD